VQSSNKPPKRRFGVLIHGTGWVAGQHAAAFQNHPSAEVVAVSSRSKSSAARFISKAALPGAQSFDNLEEALACDGVDIACICTPQHVHCANVLTAAAAGKHLVIEKPAAISLAELRLMQEAVTRAGVKTIVSFVLRWNPMFQQIKRHLAAADLGELYDWNTTASKSSWCASLTEYWAKSRSTSNASNPTRSRSGFSATAGRSAITASTLPASPATTDGPRSPESARTRRMSPIIRSMPRPIISSTA